jgi:hypothetical protein
MTEKKRKLVIVTWADSAAFDAGWKDDTKVERMAPSRITSVGWLMAETKTHVTLAAHITSEGHVTGEMCIPRGCVLKRRAVKP